MWFRFLSILFLLFLSGCTGVPSEPMVNTSSDSLQVSNATNITVFSNQTDTPVDQRQQRLIAKGGGIFDFAVLTGTNCDDYLVTYKELVDQTEEDVRDIEDEFLEEQRDLQKAIAALADARQSGNERAVDRARDDVDEEEDDVDEVEDLLDEKTEYLRKLKIILATMKEECPRLKAST
ncbi:hypothetical protein HYS50_01960 [Candidatus Woesearchaeota archaeon]|nr:hypothetical protein [Candidatus Woesearchaeota archaeon]